MDRPLRVLLEYRGERDGLPGRLASDWLPVGSSTGDSSLISFNNLAFICPGEFFAAPTPARRSSTLFCRECAPLVIPPVEHARVQFR